MPLIVLLAISSIFTLTGFYFFHRAENLMTGMLVWIGLFLIGAYLGKLAYEKLGGKDG